MKSKLRNESQDLYQLSNTKYKEDHLQGLKRLKQNLRNYNSLRDNYSVTSSNELKYNHTSSGFFSASVKRNDSLAFRSSQDPNIKKEIRLHTANGVDSKPTSSNFKFKIFTKSLLTAFNLDKQDDIEELKRMQRIIKNNENLEKIEKLPKIATICNQQKLKNIQIKLKSNKIMGEKYNPMNFYHNQSKSTTRRNINGALFQH